LLLGLLRGFKAIQKAGYSERIPYLVGVQSAACDPLTRAYQHGLAAMETAAERTDSGRGRPRPISGASGCVGSGVKIVNSPPSSLSMRATFWKPTPH
jgi:hypothetical protein